MSPELKGEGGDWASPAQPVSLDKRVRKATRKYSILDLKLGDRGGEQGTVEKKKVSRQPRSSEKEKGVAQWKLIERCHGILTNPSGRDAEKEQSAQKVIGAEKAEKLGQKVTSPGGTWSLGTLRETRRKTGVVGGKRGFHSP